VAWFMARTSTRGNEGGHCHIKPGGTIMVAEDSTSSASFFHTFGEGLSTRSDRHVATHSLTGVFRAFDRLLKADPNQGLVDHVDNHSGSYFIDCTTQDHFKEVKPSDSPSPPPSASPAAAPDTTSGSSSTDPSPSALIGNINALMNNLGITGADKN